MAHAIHLSPGQAALIEPEKVGHGDGDGAGPLSGVVESTEGGVLVLAAVPASDLPDGGEVVVSVFAPEALYRIRAGVRWLSPGRLAIDPIHDIERTQRRRWPRHELNLDVTLVPLPPADADDAIAISGRTLDIGMGGLRVETGDALPPGVDVSVILTLPDGAPLVAQATVVASDTRDDGYEYRLAFEQLDDLDTTNLAALLDPHGAAADIRRKAATGRSRRP